jgi:hypothetical protein
MSFERYTINHSNPNFFPTLSQSVQWEDFSKGRQIANLHRPQENNKTPIVRTTTVYQQCSQAFSPIHHTIIDGIRAATGIETLDLNNAMLEVYDSRYKTMGFHTDQALDLNPNSCICLFSCYELGADAHPRVLTVKNKESGHQFEVPLVHHSVVVFSTATNRRHLHKIEAAKTQPKGYVDNRWMGFTLRLAKTFVKFNDDDVPYLISAGEDEVELRELTMATDDDKGSFFKLKGRENRETDFEWPEIHYTISPSDRMMPIAPHTDVTT